MTSSELDESEDIVDIGRGMKFWTDGKLARFGIDVASGRCVEISLMEIEDFCNTVRSCETDTYSFAGRYGSNNYLFENDHPRVHIYHNQTHVMTFEDHEKFPIYDIEREVRRERYNWNVEKTAERIVSQHVDLNDEVEVEKISETIASVKIESQFVKKRKLVQLCNIEHIQNNYRPDKPQDIPEQEFTEQIKRYLNNVNITVKDDGTICYELRVDTSSFHQSIGND